MADYSLVIRGGDVVDGTGRDAVRADVAISAGKIAKVGRVDERGLEEINASGCIVTPGFIDIHTHYDGHATWTNRLSPSSEHGVTTVVTGNCGVGFAPCREEDRNELVSLMEGIEDIPEAVLTAGIPWNWESFPEYLGTLAGRSFDMDVAMQLPHAPLRVFVMGQRGIDREPANEDDCRQMGRLAAEAMKAGAIGFSTTRTLNHRNSNGAASPVHNAAEQELTAIADGLALAGSGVLQCISDFDDLEQEFDMIERVVARSGRPMSISVLQTSSAPDRWRGILDRIRQANERGHRIKAQVSPRPIGSLLGLELSYHPFCFSPSYQEIAALPLPDRVAAMREPARRARILDEFPTLTDHRYSGRVAEIENLHELAHRPDYTPARSASVADRARQAGLPVLEHLYDRLLAENGRSVFFRPAANYVDGTLDTVSAMLHHPDMLIGLGDGGAHCGLICDASLPTYLLSQWAGDLETGRFGLSALVHMLTARQADAMGLSDRGIVKPGLRADLNIIDVRKLALHRPEVVYDLPRGGKRLKQRADGYRATIVAGQVTYLDGGPTGALPGKLVRAAA